MHDFLFAFFALFALGGAVVMAFHRNIVHSAFALVGTLFGVAGLYWTLGADFLGATQLLLYVGGVTVLLLFAVMLTTRDVSRTSVGRYLAAGAAIVILGGTLFAVRDQLPALVGTGDPLPEMRPSTQIIGESLLDPNRYLVPFEVLAVLLLVVLVGAVTLARRESEG